MLRERENLAPSFKIIFFQVFPDKAQPDSHQLLQYRQYVASPKGKGKEEPRCREARIHPSTSKIDEQLIQVANEISLWLSILFNTFLNFDAFRDILKLNVF